MRSAIPSGKGSFGAMMMRTSSVYEMFKRIAISFRVKGRGIMMVRLEFGRSISPFVTTVFGFSTAATIEAKSKEVPFRKELRSMTDEKLEMGRAPTTTLKRAVEFDKASYESQRLD